MKKLLIGLLGLIGIIVLGIIIYVNIGWKKDYSEQYPLRTDIQIEPDSAMIARGKYLVYGPAHCAHCHISFEKLSDLESGTEVPLTGGFGLEIDPGTFYAPNITMDKETGIGALSDAEIYRMMRHNVRPNGMPALDLMPFINMSEDDIYAIIAYLRTTDPVNSPIINTEYNLLGKALLTVGAIKPGDPDEPVLQSIQKDSTVEYGKYIAYAVANCRGCHTNRNMQTGEYIGEEYAGGLYFGPDNLTNGWQFVTPNLTPDPSGIMANWSEQQFIERMRAGRIYEFSPMPWAAFATMDEIELKAVYRYLKSLEPVNQVIETTAVQLESE